MFRSGVVSAAAVVVLVLLSMPAWGQFQQPSQEELQMTADPKAPGAKAVYLSLDEDQDDTRDSRLFYARIKILTEKGKEMATVRFAHDPVNWFEVEARTIHADGTVIPMTAKPADLVEYKTKGLRVDSVVFTLPSVEVGSILEYRVKLSFLHGTRFPVWMVQQDLFVHKAHYSYKTGTLFGVQFTWRLAGDAKVMDDKRGTFTLDLTDVPELPDEDWMPPLNTFKWRVLFFHTEFKTKQDFWEALEKNWAKFVRDYTNPTGTLKQAVEGMVVPTDSETVKAQKIYAVVMKLENTDFTRKKSKAERKKEEIKDIHNAQDVWHDQSGSGNEIALLFVALCRIAGLNVVPMEVVDRSRALFDEDYLNIKQLDDYIAVAELDGKEVFLDPGQKMCPFGTLHWKNTLTKGFRLQDKSAVFAETPALSYKASTITRVADLTVDGSGQLQGTVRVVMQGQESLRWRQIALEEDEDEVKKRFDEQIAGLLPEGVQGDFDHFLGLTDYEANLMANVRVSGNVGTMTGKHLFLPGSFFEARSKHPFVAQDKRTIPVDMLYALTELDDVSYHLPSAYAVEVNPKPKTILWPDHAKLTITMDTEKGEIQVRRSLVYNFTILNPEEYGTLHDFYLKVASADQQQITLAKSTLAQGN